VQEWGAEVAPVSGKSWQSSEKDNPPTKEQCAPEEYALPVFVSQEKGPAFLGCSV